MNYILLLVLPSLVLLSQTISGGNETGNGTFCPAGKFVQSKQDNTLTFFTDNLYDYDKVSLKPTSSSRLRVRVKASKNAHFKLQTPKKSVFYEIVLGAASNTRSDIRSPTGAHLNYTFTTNLLRLDEYLPFVIAWNNSKIVVAREHNGSDIILEWSAPAANINVEMVGLAGYRLGFEATGDSHFEQYQLQETEVSYFSVATPAQSAYKRFQRTLDGEDGLSFNLSTAGVATIVFLASDDRNFSQPTYKLNIGAEANTQTVLYYRSHTLLRSNHTPGILSNSERRKFWVAWKDGRFAFGLGSEFYKNSKLICPDSMVVEKFHSMAVNSTQQAQWDFVVQGYSCVAPCQVGWYSNKTTGGCRRCSMQLSNCFSCTQTQSFERPICTSCINGTLMLGEDGECLTVCSPHIGYTPDYEQKKCVCSYGACCGPIAFRFCFLIIPCLLGVLLLVPFLLWVGRRLRRFRLINLERIDLNLLSMIPKRLPTPVVENAYAHTLRNRQDSVAPVYASLGEDLEEPSYQCID